MKRITWFILSVWLVFNTQAECRFMFNKFTKVYPRYELPQIRHLNDNKFAFPIEDRMLQYLTAAQYEKITDDAGIDAVGVQGLCNPFETEIISDSILTASKTELIEIEIAPAVNSMESPMTEFSTY